MARRKPVRPTSHRTSTSRPLQSDTGSEEQTSSPDPLDVISDKSSEQDESGFVYRLKHVSQRIHSSSGPSESSSSSDSQSRSQKRQRINGNGEGPSKAPTTSASRVSTRQESSEAEEGDEGLDEWATFLSDSEEKRRRSSGQSDTASNSLLNESDQTYPHFRPLEGEQGDTKLHLFHLSPVRRKFDVMTGDEAMTPVDAGFEMAGDAPGQDTGLDFGRSGGGNAELDQPAVRAVSGNGDGQRLLETIEGVENIHRHVPQESAAASLENPQGDNDSVPIPIDVAVQRATNTEASKEVATLSTSAHLPSPPPPANTIRETALAGHMQVDAQVELPAQVNFGDELGIPDRTQSSPQLSSTYDNKASEIAEQIQEDLQDDNANTGPNQVLDATSIADPPPHASTTGPIPNTKLKEADHEAQSGQTPAASADAETLIAVSASAVPTSAVKQQTPDLEITAETAWHSGHIGEKVNNDAMESDAPAGSANHATSTPGTLGADTEEGEEELDEDMPASSANGEAETDADGDIDMAGSSASVRPPTISANGSKAKPEKKKAASKSKPTTIKKADTASKRASKETKTKGKVNDLKVSSKSKTARFTPDSSPVKMARQDTPESTNDRVWCVCRRKESEDDDEVTMVGCESCDDWFHPKCVGLTEDQVAKLDVYICRSCERSTKQKTIYKKSCKRDGCEKGLGDRESKFCSDLCAYKHMKAFTDSITNKKTIKQLATSFVAYPKPAPAKIQHHSIPPATANPDRRQATQQVIDSIHVQLASTNAALDIVLKRQQILQAATDRADALPPIVIQAEENRSSKSKRKGGGGPSEDKQCGWDARLIWDDGEVREWDGAEGGDGEFCNLPKRKCDRHQGWQKTTTISLEIEHAQLVKQQKLLVKQETDLAKASEAQVESEQARTAFNQRLAAKGRAN